MNFINLLLALRFIWSLAFVEATVYVRTPPSGPAVWRAGAECLHRVAASYFLRSDSEQPKNIVILRSGALKSPARQILETYARLTHVEMLQREWTVEERWQIRIFSDTDDEDGVHPVALGDFWLADYYVIAADSVEEFMSSMKHLSSLTSASWNPAGKFIILFNNPAVTASPASIALDILRIMFINHHAVNVVVGFASQINRYELFTGDPYHATAKVPCGVMKPLYVGACLNGQLEDSFMTDIMLRMPKVPQKMENCTLNVCARISPPFVNEGCRSGMEMKIVKILQEKIHFDVNLTCSNEPRGEKDGLSGNWSHLLGKIRADQCDFIVGGFYPDINVHLDFGATFPVFQNRYTWFVPVAPFRAQWKGLLFIFTGESWIGFAIVLVVATCTWYLFGRILPERQEFAKTFLDAWGMLLIASVNSRPISTTLRILFITMALYGLNVTTLYTSQLIYVLTHPQRDHQIDTIEEVLDMGTPLGGRMETQDWFWNDDPQDQLIFFLYNDSAPFTPSVEAIKRVARGEQVVLMSRMFVESTKELNSVHGLATDVFSSQMEIICERGFPLLRRFHSLIVNLNDMGLVTKFINDFEFNRKILRHIRDRDKVETIEIVLTLYHLEGAFTVLILGSLLAILTFLGELTANAIQRYRSRKRWRKVMAKVLTVKRGLKKVKTRSPPPRYPVKA